MSIHPYTRLFILPSAPTVDEDSSEGYEVGDVVISGGVIYDCTDNTTGAAVWQERPIGVGEETDPVFLASEAASFVTGDKAKLDGIEIGAEVNDAETDAIALAALSSHLSDTADAHAASAITNTPTGSIAATDVQTAINELATEKSDSAHTHSYLPTSYLDTDVTLAANSDSKIASQKATKTYGDARYEIKSTAFGYTPTTADFTISTVAATNGVLTFIAGLDLSGLTGNRTIFLPAAAVGTKIIFIVTTGHATYSCSVSPVAGGGGSTLHGGASAWERTLQFEKQTAMFACNNAGNWELVSTENTTLSGRMLLPFGVYQAISPLSANGDPYAVTIDRTISLVKWSQFVYVATANDGSNYWTVELRRQSDNAVINSISTAALSPNTNTVITDTTFSISSVGLADFGIYMRATKTGSPGNLYLQGPLLEIST